MAVAVENNYNSYICINRKRCFLLLLLLNCLLAGIYYIHEQNQPKNIRGLTTYTKQVPNKSPTSKQTISKAMKFIRKTLENEYNHDDIMTFYNITEREFSLGLRCSRKSKPQPVTTITTIVNNENNSNMTTVRYLNLK